MQPEMAEILFRAGRSQAERILGLGDRDRDSRTYGCYDRMYWHYAMIDFPSAWFQGACRYLSLLYQVDHPDNPFFQSDHVRRWALAAADFFARMTHRSGAADEAYPGEHSFCATAFCAGDALYTYRVLQAEPPRLEHTVEFLGRAPQSPAANQEAARCYALAEARLAGYDAQGWLDSALERLLCSYQAHGFFPEYGGYDLGYTSITCGLLENLLAALPGLPQAKTVEEIIGRCLDRADQETDAMGRYDWSVMNRRTQFIYPLSAVKRGHPLADKVLQGIRSGVMVQPGWLDDRYVIKLATDYLEAAQSLVVDQSPGKP